MAWDPDTYLAFDHLRLRPGLDLLDRVPLTAPRTVVDLGCGPGNLTLHLAGRFPDAAVAGLDTSPEMLARAVELDTATRVSWMQADAASWVAAERVDLVFANASLHWVDDHTRQMARLLGQVSEGGVLAVQMPDNHDQPSHTLLAETVDSGPWRDRLRPLLRPHPVLAPERYHALLRPLTARLDVWQTTYWQALTGDDPVLEWTSGSVLRPLLAALPAAEREAFTADYAARLRQAYPAGHDGVTLFPFRRLFIMAQRPGAGAA